LGLNGRETYDIIGLDDNLQPVQELTVKATAEDGSVKTFQVTARINTLVELEYYRNGGILHTVLRNFLKN
jgi:aconitate hydratase